MSLSLGKRRALQQCAQDDGTFAMLAMDQRGSLARMIDPDAPDQVSFQQVIAIKRDVIAALSPLASAVLLDVEYGYGPCVASGALSGRAGLLLAIEKSGYEGDPTARRTSLLDGWDVERTRLAGASGVKLLIYYRPDAPNAAEQEALVAEVAAACDRWELPLFLEPLHYSLDPAVKVVPNAERRRVVIETARRLVPLGVDVLKAEFPLDVKQSNDQAEWADACAELSDACPVPWVLLSAGVDFPTYAEQVKVACASGASGVLCGRAIWKEAVQLPPAQRVQFLQTTARERFRQLSQLVSEAARPYTHFYPASDGADLENWYR
ncbi:tagatose 1,6-diphosphate aldolase [Litorilinea aerophila]|uniref:Tagatose 1,6-diphosphate aldolase n=1 Tax=Litorilinea aerophila TaxID=1204385 RepID=A0A540VF51_9CHLR|nr:tagatose 1,6-diphosphate aldolase [Litorilinea aerophila]MCC9076914.1 tagatose 1,6-diphosphate aldolase [Litorilinea aerophila]GIV78490.1 MAG: tagatose 1,6-diphosphate aldolase [Litorilinea sp.]